MVRHSKDSEEKPEARNGEAESDEERPAGVQDIFRKMMALGLTGLFTTESAIRGALGDTVPKEWVDFVGEQSEKTRAELAQRIAEEFGQVLRQVDLADFARELLEGRTVEVEAKIRFAPKAAEEEEDTAPEREKR